jgi:hypothetical protein
LDQSPIFRTTCRSAGLSLPAFACLHLVPVVAAGENRHMTKFVIVNDRMQKGYRYWLSAPAGRGFHPELMPELTPKQMLALGVLGLRPAGEAA